MVDDDCIAFINRFFRSISMKNFFKSLTKRDVGVAAVSSVATIGVMKYGPKVWGAIVGFFHKEDTAPTGEKKAA